jgi:DNA polymerase elongation subunit (family B)
MLKEILETRFMVKREMKGLKAEKDKMKNTKNKGKNKGNGEGKKSGEGGGVEGGGGGGEGGGGEEEEEEGKGGDVLYRVLEARQLAIKLLANVTCKYCITCLLSTCSIMM